LFWRERDHRQRPNFRQRRIVAFTASLCHAKITPSALQCGDLPCATPNCLTQGLNSSWAIFDSACRGAKAGRAYLADGIGLSKTCPVLKPFKRAARCARCLIFDLELFDFSGLGLGGLDPFLHFRQRHDRFGIARKL
jgi:hypothetical protein